MNRSRFNTSTKRQNSENNSFLEKEKTDKTKEDMNASYFFGLE